MDADELRAQRRKQNDFTDQVRETGWYHSFELPDGTSIHGPMSLEWERARWARFPIPADLTGTRVLDIGAWDGWFSFEAERRGATVTSIDCQEQEKYLWLHRKLGSKAVYRNLDIFELPWVDLGKFDIVFCLGVLYHLRHPLLGLEILCGLTTEIAIVETLVIDGANWQDHVNDIPSMEFYETIELNGNFDNWTGPTVGCVLAMCRAAGFARVELIYAVPENAVVACYRKWLPEPDEPAQALPELLAAVNPVTLGVNFNSRRDHDIDCWFRTGSTVSAKEELMLEVGEFGAAATLIHPEDGGYYAKFTLPAGAKQGWNDVRLRLANSRFSAAQRIAIDMPPVVERIVIAGVRDSIDWEPDRVNSTDGGHLSCWVEGLPENVDRGNLKLWLGGERMAILWIGELVDGRRQINAKAPQDCPKGERSLRVECAGVMSDPVAVKVI